MEPVSRLRRGHATGDVRPEAVAASRKSGSRAAGLHERLHAMERMVLISLPFGEDRYAMKNSFGRICLAIVVVWAVSMGALRAQQATPLTQEQKDQRVQTEKELESVAVIERKVMIPMRDGVRLATDIYRPKNASGPVPIVWVRTPYNFNFWDVRNGLPADMKTALTAVKRGYAYVVQNERGHFFSEGNYEILGAPRTDGTDMLDWLKSQIWTNGKVSTTGCSSTAEYQMAIAAMGHPAYAAMNIQSFGAGVGRVGPYYE